MLLENDAGSLTIVKTNIKQDRSHLIPGTLSLFTSYKVPYLTSPLITGLGFIE